MGPKSSLAGYHSHKENDDAIGPCGSKTLGAILGGGVGALADQSRSSAQSRWVNEEVRTYKQMHGEARVLVVIVVGEPNATDLPGRAHEECFPPAIQFRVNEDGVITDTPAEPIAADLRPNGDGKRAVKLKLIAGLAGLKLDDLVRREAQRRQRRMTWLTVAASALALVMSGLTVVAIHARADANFRAYRRYAEAETAFAAALKIVEATAARKPGDAAAQIEVGQDISWLATANDRLNETLNSTELAIRFAVLRRLGFKVRSERIGSILNRREFRHPYYVSEMARTVLLLHRPKIMQ